MTRGGGNWMGTAGKYHVLLLKKNQNQSLHFQSYIYHKSIIYQFKYILIYASLNRYIIICYDILIFKKVLLPTF